MASESQKIETMCPACGTQYRLVNSAVGKSAKCKCGASFVVAIQQRSGSETRRQQAQTRPALDPPARPIDPSFEDQSLAISHEYSEPMQAAKNHAAQHADAVEAFDLGESQEFVLPGQERVKEACPQHATAAVVGHCTLCGIAICRTCLFAFPPSTTCCPSCATDPTLRISLHRKIMIYSGFGCAIFSTCFMAIVASGLLKSFAEALWGVEILKTIISVPMIAGIGLSAGAYNAEEGNPNLLWVGAIWNSLLFLSLVLAVILFTVVFQI